MAHFHIKKKNGRPYLYVREIARVNGKPKVVSQVYIGSPDRVASLAAGREGEERQLKVQEFGALWLAQQMDNDIDVASIIDDVIPRTRNETGPSVGEYFLMTIWNRMVDTVSKNRTADWYEHTAIQQIRPVEIEELTSQRYWEKWDRVSEKALDEITRRFFAKLWKVESPEADCLLFGTTNYYTYMASNTPSDLAHRGKNKDGKHHLRQVGLGLMVSRDSRLPLYYRVYPDNLHDSKLFQALMDKMFEVACSLNKTKERMTVVIDKVMNSQDNYAWIDEHARIHFITTYSTYFAQDLAATPLDRFEPVDTEKNRHLEHEGYPQERIMAYRTTGEFWGKKRAVVVTYNPRTARKQAYSMDSKMEEIRQELLLMRSKVRDKAPHWRDGDAIRQRYLHLCERLHVPSDLYAIECNDTKDGLSMSFRKNAHRVSLKYSLFGKSIIITDNTDWTTSEIVDANSARWEVEDRFRQSKHDDLVGTLPIRHWTDSKIKCHLFTCVVAMTYLRRLELKLQAFGIKRTADNVMQDMHRLHSVLTMTDGRSKPRRRIENPSKTQAEVLSAFGYAVNDKGALQPIKP